MLRWFRELRNPREKCARIGHDLYTVRRRYYLYPPTSWRRGVADTAWICVERCRRCGRDGPETIEDRSVLDGLTMADDRWDELYANGRLLA